MGGHAWKGLSTPRISPDLYRLARDQAHKALQQIFRHVAVPMEMPSKADHGDVDFLVAGPLSSDPSKKPENGEFDYPYHVSRIKALLSTPHGRKGFLTEKVMYFAIPAPGREDEDDIWVQIDVKVCESSEMFEWEKWCLDYASHAKMIGSMIKPLGLTTSPEGLFVRVEGLDKTNLERSMLFLTRESKEVLKIVGLSNRVFQKGFCENEELFEYLASSYLFNPAHFAERLKDEGYIRHMLKQSAPYVSFVQSWIPERYPGYRPSSEDGQAPGTDINAWYSTTRASVRDKVLAKYPKLAQEYYERRGAYLHDVEEQRLRELIMPAIPDGLTGWSEDLPQPEIIYKLAAQEMAVPQTPRLQLMTSLEPLTIDTSNSPPLSVSSISTHPWASPSTSKSVTDPGSPVSSICTDGAPSFTRVHTAAVNPTNPPLLLETLPRTPPLAFAPRPPPKDISDEAKLACLFRWTLFDGDGNPYLAQEPRLKGLEMDWASSGADDEVLVKWAGDMWWTVWTRQFRTNWVGMWKKRMEKEDRKNEREESSKVEMAAEENKETAAEKKETATEKKETATGSKEIVLEENRNKMTEGKEKDMNAEKEEDTDVNKENEDGALEAKKDHGETTEKEEEKEPDFEKMMRRMAEVNKVLECWRA